MKVTIPCCRFGQGQCETYTELFAVCAFAPIYHALHPAVRGQWASGRSAGIAGGTVLPAGISEAFVIVDAIKLNAF